MAYKIEYASELSNRYPQNPKKKSLKPKSMILILLVMAAALWIRLNGIPDFLIPGDAVITRAAASAFLENMHDGMPIGEATTVFCRQILDGAGA